MHCEILSDFPPAYPRQLADLTPPTICHLKNAVQSVRGVVACPTPTVGDDSKRLIGLRALIAYRLGCNDMSAYIVGIADKVSRHGISPCGIYMSRMLAQPSSARHPGPWDAFDDHGVWYSQVAT